MEVLHTVVARERDALSAHRESLRGAPLPPPASAPRGTFLHGFFLPFSLIGATLRDRQLRGPYLRVTALRLLAVAALTALALPGALRGRHDKQGGVVLHYDRAADASSGGADRGVHVDAPGLHVDIKAQPEETGDVKVLGVTAPVVGVDGRAEAEKAGVVGQNPGAASGWRGRLAGALSRGWGWLLALLAVLSASSTVVVALSRRYDDWLSFEASRLAYVAPEDPTAPTPKIALDLKWLYKKLYRRARGYVVFAAGVPVLALALLVPAVGHYLFQAALVVWGWYWLGVFTAAKSAHAWADEGSAPSPAIIRAVNERLPAHALTSPLRAYGRLWAWFTRGVAPPAATFERTPAAFLGLALARAVLSAPGLYLLARPVVPVAAGRLIAEGDPLGRFSAPPAPSAEPSSPPQTDAAITDAAITDAAIAGAPAARSPADAPVLPRGNSGAVSAGARPRGRRGGRGRANARPRPGARRGGAAWARPPGLRLATSPRVFPPVASPVPEQAAGVRAIILYKTVKGAAQLLLSAGLMLALLWHGMAAELSAASHALAHHTTSAWSIHLSRLLLKLATPRGVLMTGVALGLDGALTTLEGWALSTGKPWGKWLVVIGGALLIPLELFELTRHLRLGRLVVLALNVAIVVYLARRAATEGSSPGRSATA